MKINPKKKKNWYIFSLSLSLSLSLVYSHLGLTNALLFFYPNYKNKKSKLYYFTRSLPPWNPRFHGLYFSRLWLEFVVFGFWLSPKILDSLFWCWVLWSHRQPTTNHAGNTINPPPLTTLEKKNQEIIPNQAPHSTRNNTKPKPKWIKPPPTNKKKKHTTTTQDQDPPWAKTQQPSNCESHSPFTTTTQANNDES